MLFPEIKIDNNLALTKPKIPFAEDLFEIYNNENVNRELNSNNILDLNKVIEKLNFFITGFNEGKTLYWVILDLSNSKAIGYIAYFFHDNYWQIEYALNEKYWGNGIMMQCFSKTVKFFVKNNQTNLIATVNEGNISSIKILKRNNFDFFKINNVKHQNKKDNSLNLIISVR